MKDMFRDSGIADYSQFSRSFSKISAGDIKKLVDDEYGQGGYWPDPLIQINPNYNKASTVPALVLEDAPWSAPHLSAFPFISDRRAPPARRTGCRQRTPL